MEARKRWKRRIGVGGGDEVRSDRRKEGWKCGKVG